MADTLIRETQGEILPSPCIDKPRIARLTEKMLLEALCGEGYERGAEDDPNSSFYCPVEVL